MKKLNKSKILIGLMSVFVMLFVVLLVMPSDASAATCTHPSKATRTRAATCTTSGKSEYYCTKCGKVIRSTTIPTPGHNWTTVSASPSCTKAGYVKTYCTRCNAIYSYTSKGKIGHNPTKPTCTSASRCTMCGTIVTNALGHDYSEATCTKPKTCSRCRGTDGSALGHNYSEATCTSAKTCSRCGGTDGSPLGHSKPETRAVKEATCTSSGKCEGYCTRCGIVISSSTIPTPGHNWKTETVSPSCTKVGYEKTYCARCNETYSYHEKGKLGHNFTAPTCTSDSKCTMCGTIGTKALGHCTTTTTKNAPTCVTNGTSVTKCTRIGCGYSVTDTISALGNHIADPTVSPTISPVLYDNPENSANYHMVRCKDCGEFFRENHTMVIATYGDDSGTHFYMCMDDGYHCGYKQEVEWCTYKEPKYYRHWDGMNETFKIEKTCEICDNTAVIIVGEVKKQLSELKSEQTQAIVDVITSVVVNKAFDETAKLLSKTDEIAEAYIKSKDIVSFAKELKDMSLLNSEEIQVLYNAIEANVWQDETEMTDGELEEAKAAEYKDKDKQEKREPDYVISNPEIVWGACKENYESLIND